ncbi:MAG: hypothetical protein ACLGJD_07555 [Gammaproteobacteria bacterium]
MTSTQNLDPFEMWRQAVTKLEGDINSMANKSMGTEEFTRLLAQVSPVAIGMQQIFEKVLDSYFKALRIPSKKDITALAEGLQRLEDKIDALLINDKPEPLENRPLRTRRPPSPSDVPAEPAKAKAKTSTSGKGK